MFKSLAFILLGSFWGGSFLAIKFVVSDVPPVFGAAARVGLSLAILTVVYLVARKPFAVPAATRWKIWLAGLFQQGFPFALVFWGERFITPGLAGILNGTVPIWTFLLALLFLRHDEPFSFRKLAGLLFGFIGICFIFGPKIGVPEEKQAIVGTIAVTGMAICYAIGTVMNRRLLVKGEEINRYASLYQQHISSLLFLIVVSVILEGWPNVLPLFHSWSAALALLYLSLFSNALAWLLFFYLLQKWGSLKTTSVTYIIPLVALISDYIAFGTIPRTYELLGTGTIFLGILLIQYRKRVVPTV